LAVFAPHLLSASMGKRRDAGASPSGVPNRDIFQRLNFLYQASAFLQSVSAPPLSPSKPQPAAAEDLGSLSSAGGARRRRREVREIAARDLACSYVRAMREVGKKTTVKMDPSVKRTLCRACDAVLIPGTSSSVRIVPSGPHRHLIATVCLYCSATRRIPAPPAPTVPRAVLLASEPAGAVDGRTAAEPMCTDADSSHATRARRRRRAGAPHARLPPLFERDGHAVFRGNEQIVPPPSARND